MRYNQYKRQERFDGHKRQSTTGPVSAHHEGGTTGGQDIVINACELRTRSAFRFGSRESGCWRYGRLPRNDVPVAMAVAASAAYPVFLPALDRTYSFIKDGQISQNRVVLTDGGLYDNLGATCVEPDREEAYSTNVFKPPYIISCNAGYGMFGNEVIPYGFYTSSVVRCL